MERCVGVVTCVCLCVTVGVSVGVCVKSFCGCLGVKCLSVDVGIYSTCAFFNFIYHVNIDVSLYAFAVLVLF